MNEWWEWFKEIPTSVKIKYFIVVPYESYVYDANEWNNRFMERGIVFRTKEEAIACAKKMLAVVKREG